MAKNPNLKGHKREGKRFIPPLKQLAGVREQSYVDDMLPELLWLGLIHDRKGYVFGRQTLEAVIEVVKDREEQNSEKAVNFALQYAYATLGEEERSRIVHEWRRRSLLDDIQHALAPLILLYDGFSLRFAGVPDTKISEPALISRVSDCVANHLDKYQVPGVALHGSMMLSRLIAGKMFFSKDIKLPDFNAAIDSPESNEGKRAAGFMRASAMGEMGMLEVPNDWAKHFWNRNAELSPCKYPIYLEDSSE